MCPHRSPCAQRRVLAGLTVAVLATSGCGLPTWSELIGQKKEEAAPIQQMPAPAPTPQPLPQPVKPKPEEVVARFQQLKPFDIDDSALGSITALEEGTEAVTELTLNGSKVTNAGIRNLSRLTHLAKLDVRNSAIDKDGTAAIGQATSLEELRLDGAEMDDASISNLRPLQNLKVLDLTNTRLGRAGFADIASLQSLEQLHISHSSITDEDLANIANVSSLKRLYVTDCGLTDRGLAQLGKLDALEVLNISGNASVHGEGFAVIAKNKGLASLKELGMAGTGLNEKGAKAIIMMKNLESLNLYQMGGMQDVHVVLMTRGLDKLKYLNIGNNGGLSANSLSGLKGSDTIEEVHAQGCGLMNDQVFQHLDKCKNIKKLIVGGQCTAAAAAQFKMRHPDVEIIGVN